MSTEFAAQLAGHAAAVAGVRLLSTSTIASSKEKFASNSKRSVASFSCIIFLVCALLFPTVSSFSATKTESDMLRYPPMLRVASRKASTAGRAQQRFPSKNSLSMFLSENQSVERSRGFSNPKDFTKRRFSGFAFVPSLSGIHRQSRLHHEKRDFRLFSTIPKAEEATGTSGSLGGKISDTVSTEDNLLENYLEEKGIKSRPKPGGTWDVYDPLGWAKSFGHRSPEQEERLHSLAQLGPGDEGYFDVSEITVPGVTIVRTKEEARIVLEKLYEAPLDTIHAADTEVMEIDVKNVGPVGNGFTTCFSLYSGPDFDYGLGAEPGSTLWVDNLDDSYGVMQEFKDWFEDERFLTVWHNYGFDRHIMWNEGIDVKGFGGDTMHMARLVDTNRMKSGSGGYSLSALSTDLLKTAKVNMKNIFGVPRKRKDGTDGSLIDIPPVEVLQRDPKTRVNWILYSAYDAKVTWNLREKLQNDLERKRWFDDNSMWDYYWMHMRPFGEVLTDMERRGVRVDAKEYLAGVEKQARKDRDHHTKAFKDWVVAQYPEGERGHALALNPASATQLAIFLFGGAPNPKTNESTPTERVFKIARADVPQEALDSYAEEADRLKEADPLVKQQGRAFFLCYTIAWHRRLCCVSSHGLPFFF